MAHSLRRAPVLANCCASSDAPWKARVSRAYRRRLSVLVAGALADPFADVVLDRRAVATVYDSGKDGKKYRRDAIAADLRK